MKSSQTRPASAPRRTATGFTLVEMVVTIMIASILIMMGAPAFNRIVMNSRLASQTNDLITAVQVARSEAIKRNAGLQLCRVASDASTTCANGNGAWEHWIVRTLAGSGADTIVRRGLVNTYGGTLTVRSTFSNDTVTFGSDGLARSGGNLVNANDDDAQGFRVCSSAGSDENIRRLAMGAGSRLSTVKESGEC